MYELLEHISCQNGLEIIETTSERNGYPANLRKAIIGFENFEEAEKIANEYNLSIEIFTKRDGQQLYYRTGNKAYEPFKNSADNYGDNYDGFTVEDIDNFYEEEVKPRIEEFDNFDDLSTFIENKKEIFEKLELLDEDEMIITCEGRYHETVPKASMSCCFDTTTKVIGLIK